MTQDIKVRKNMELLEEFMKYGNDHPEIFDTFPKDAQLIILPENDPELFEVNKKILESCKQQNRKYVVFRMRMPERSVPHLEEVS